MRKQQKRSKAREQRGGTQGLVTQAPVLWSKQSTRQAIPCPGGLERTSFQDWRRVPTGMGPSQAQPNTRLPTCHRPRPQPPTDPLTRQPTTPANPSPPLTASLVACPGLPQHRHQPESAQHCCCIAKAGLHEMQLQQLPIFAEMSEARIHGHKWLIKCTQALGAGCAGCCCRCPQPPAFSPVLRPVRVPARLAAVAHAAAPPTTLETGCVGAA